MNTKKRCSYYQDPARVIIVRDVEIESESGANSTKLFLLVTHSLSVYVIKLAILYVTNRKLGNELKQTLIGFYSR